MSRRRRSTDNDAAPRRTGPLRRLLGRLWRWGLRPLLILAALLFAWIWGQKAYHAIRSASLTEPERLAEDLARLERLVLLEHPAPFGNGDRKQIRDALDRADAAIGELERGGITREGVLAHFFEVVASLRDPHTAIVGRHETFGILRASFRLFEDEVRLTAAPERADLGARVLAIDGIPTAEALERIRPLVAYANESGFLDGAPDILRSPGLLHHAGVVADPARVTLRLLRLDGSTGSLVLPRVTREEYRSRRPAAYTFDDAELPRYRRADRGAYWLEALPDREAVYIRFASSASSADQPLTEIARRALAARDALPGPVVVDLRGNPGGDPQAHIALVATLASDARTRGPANLKVLVDRGTYSAAVVAGADLERRTGASVVGEEPGDRAHLTTDARPFTLRHCGLAVWIPTGRMRTAGGAGGRSRLIPDRFAAPTFADWFAGRDPALEVALAPLAPPAGDTTGGRERDGPLPSGRFAFDAQRTLTLTREGAGYRAEVTGLGSDLLIRGGDGIWAGGIHRGLRADPEGRLERRLPHEAWAVLPARSEAAPLELASKGRMAAARQAYLALTSNGSDRSLVAALGLPSEGYYRYREGASREGRVLFELARALSPADPLIPLQHSLLRKEAEGRWIPPGSELARAMAACARSYARAELLNDWRLCL